MAHTILETTRLRIVEANELHASFFVSLLNSETWISMIGDSNIKTDADALGYIDKALISSYKTNGYGLYVMMLKKTNAPIGICGFVKRSFLEFADLGFSILPEYERQGYTYESSVVLLEMSKTQLKLPSVLAITTDKNIGAIGLLNQLGFNSQGTIAPEEGKQEFLLFQNNCIFLSHRAAKSACVALYR